MKKILRIENETRYSTRALRKLLRHALDKMGWPEAAFAPRPGGRAGPKSTPRGMQIKIKSRGVNDGDVSGEAYVQSNRMTMFVSPDRFNVDAFLRVAMHEIGHCQGQKHSEMAPVRDFFPGRPKAFEDVEHLTERKPKAKKKDIVRKRYERAKELLSEWETKLKTAKTKRQKYSDRVAYYERKYSKERLEGTSE
jgi:vacuolar-type H+-ATPase subunit E/Vma4